MKSIKIILLILFLLGIGIVFSSRISREPSLPAGEQGTGSVESGFFGLSLKNLDGQEFKLADLINRPLVINSWAVWCPFCRKELSDFVAAQKEFGAEVVIVAIDRAEEASAVKKYTDELGITNDIVFLLDPNDSFYRSIGGFSMPETIFVNKKGEVVLHKRGPMDLEEIRERILNLISS